MNPVIEALLVAATFTGLYGIAKIAAWLHERHPGQPTPAPSPGTTAVAPRRAPVTAARDTKPYEDGSAIRIGDAGGGGRTS